jgi:predicted  nucleic acid-binding Zn ribbon protein
MRQSELIRRLEKLENRVKEINCEHDWEYLEREFSGSALYSNRVKKCKKCNARVKLDELEWFDEQIKSLENRLDSLKERRALEGQLEG